MKTNRYHSWTPGDELGDRGCRSCGLSWGQYNTDATEYAFNCFPLDLSPLAGFMRVGEGAKKTRDWLPPKGARNGDIWIATQCGDGTQDWAYVYDDSRPSWDKWARMYGWPFDQEPEAPKPPEKSPVDREIERMMEKRKAKREAQQGADVTPEATKAYQAERKEIEQGRALGNAISKLTHWEQTVHERIMPYRGVAL